MELIVCDVALVEELWTRGAADCGGVEGEVFSLESRSFVDGGKAETCIGGRDTGFTFF